MNIHAFNVIGIIVKFLYQVIPTHCFNGERGKWAKGEREKILPRRLPFSPFSLFAISPFFRACGRRNPSSLPSGRRGWAATCCRRASAGGSPHLWAHRSYR